jgi:hypothetical protein
LSITIECMAPAKLRYQSAITFSIDTTQLPGARVHRLFRSKFRRFIRTRYDLILYRVLDWSTATSQDNADPNDFRVAQQLNAVLTLHYSHVLENTFLAQIMS